jgi:hypothetical protein
MLVRPHVHARTGALVLLALLPTVIWASAAPAIAAVTTTTVKCPTLEIIRGVSTTGATVATPGAKTRTLDASQATAFMQTWLAYSIVGNAPQNHPPANLPVSRLTVPVIENAQPPQSLVILYATDGTKVWVGAPAPTASAPTAEKWILAPRPADTTSAFLGNLVPTCVDPASTASSTAPGSPTAHLVEKSSGSDDGATWALIGVGVVIVGAVGFLVTRARRRRAHAG